MALHKNFPKDKFMSLIKVYIPNISKTTVGGGFTFCRNLRNGLKDKVQFVDNWKDCDIIFVFGVTTIDKADVHEAVNNGRKLVLRVDNIPRKSRNKRMTPYERLKEFSEKASAVVFQSEWCKTYASYYTGDGVVINNGVDTSVFNKDGRFSDGKTYLYINYNDNPNKRFDEAIFRFDMDWREDNNIHLVIAGNAPSIYIQNPDYNWDLTVPAKVEYVGVIESPTEVADLMKECDYLLYPSFAEAAPNTVIEALACGMKIKYPNQEGGTMEMINLHKDKPYTIQQMADEYMSVFNKIMKGQNNDKS